MLWEAWVAEWLKHWQFVIAAKIWMLHNILLFISGGAKTATIQVRFFLASLMFMDNAAVMPNKWGTKDAPYK